MWKNVQISIQYMAPGFEPTNFQTWVITHNHKTRAPTLYRFFVSLFISLSHNRSLSQCLSLHFSYYSVFALCILHFYLTLSIFLSVWKSTQRRTLNICSACIVVVITFTSTNTFLLWYSGRSKLLGLRRMEPAYRKRFRPIVLLLLLERRTLVFFKGEGLSINKSAQ